MVRPSTRGVTVVLVALAGAGVAALAGLIPGCDKPKPSSTASSVAPTTTGVPATTAAKKDVASEPPGKATTPLCLRFSDDVAKAVGQAVISVRDEVLPDAPLRCIYRTAALPALIEVGKSGDLAAERKGFETGGYPSDSPLGNGAFRTQSNGFYQVIGQKGATRLAVGGTARFHNLEALWLKVAEAL